MSSDHAAESQQPKTIGAVGVVIFIPLAVVWCLFWLIGITAHAIHDGFRDGWYGLWYEKGKLL